MGSDRCGEDRSGIRHPGSRLTRVLPVPASARFRRWARSPWSDVTLAVLAAIAQLWPLLSTTGPWHWWGYVAAACSALPLVARRRAPLPVLLVCFAFGALYDLVDAVAAQPLWYGPLIALYTLSDRSGRRVRWAIVRRHRRRGLLTSARPTPHCGESCCP